MKLWLAIRLFGSGRGLGIPAVNGVLVWLLDERTNRGDFYHWSGWHGSQLASFEWALPRPQARRFLLGREFVVFQASRRRWFPFLWHVSWAWTRRPSNLDEASAALRRLQADFRAPLFPTPADGEQSKETDDE